jgi:hypothetical protein
MQGQVAYRSPKSNGRSLFKLVWDNRRRLLGIMRQHFRACAPRERASNAKHASSPKRRTLIHWAKSQQTCFTMKPLLFLLLAAIAGFGLAWHAKPYSLEPTKPNHLLTPRQSS